MDDKGSVIINLKTSEPKKYFCSYCNTSLTPLTREDMLVAYVCTKCIIEYWPKLQAVKKQSKFDLPGPPTDSHGNVTGDNDIPIATIDSLREREPSTTSYKPKLSPLFKALEAQGFKITSYEEK